MADKQPVTLRELEQSLQELINKGYEVKRRFNAELDALHDQTRAVQMQVVHMLTQERSEEAAKS